MRPTIVLVHGAFAESSSWDQVIDRLEDAGHPVVAVANPLRGPASDAEAVSDQIRAIDGPVVLAGHSYGGLVVPVLADRLRARVRAVVVIDGLVPDPRDSSFAIRSHAAEERRAAAERGGGLFPPPRDADPRLVPMPISAFEAPVAFEPVDVPRTFVWCTRSDMGAQAERARERGWRVVEVDAGHWLPLEDPSLCARLLLGASTAVGPRRR
jgi:pimeloyl-ACP methyl ester carboxylesterase